MVFPFLFETFIDCASNFGISKNQDTTSGNSKEYKLFYKMLYKYKKQPIEKCIFIIFNIDSF